MSGDTDPGPEPASQHEAGAGFATRIQGDTDPGPEPASQPPAQRCLIVAENRQSDPVVAQQRWVGLMSAVLHAEGVIEPWEAGLWFVDANEMAELNQLHRGIAQPTDVLALGTDDGGALRACGEPRLVGDVIICPSVAAANAATHAKTVTQELALLVVHGTLHLLGYDHQEDAAAAQMQQREHELLAEPVAGRCEDLRRRC